MPPTISPMLMRRQVSGTQMVILWYTWNPEERDTFTTSRRFQIPMIREEKVNFEKVEATKMFVLTIAKHPNKYCCGNMAHIVSNNNFLF